MKNLKDRLTVVQFDSDTYTDKSFEAFDFLKDEFALSGTLYIGFTKPINTLYIHMKVATASASSTTWQYWDGTAWTDAAAYDDARGFSRSGFVQWERPDDEATTAVNGTTLYWYKVTLPSLDAETRFWGIGALFCDVPDLKTEYRYIEESELYADPENPSHMGSLVAARDRMLEELHASAWDIFNHPDTKKAATMLALSIIFNSVSDRPDDKFAVLAQAYKDEYRAYKSNLLLQIDRDDDGEVDDSETVSPQAKRWSL